MFLVPNSVQIGGRFDDPDRRRLGGNGEGFSSKVRHEKSLGWASTMRTDALSAGFLLMVFGVLLAWWWSRKARVDREAQFNRLVGG